MNTEMATKRGPGQIFLRSPQKEPALQYLVVGFPVSRTGRQHISVVKATLLWSFVAADLAG